MPPAPFVGDSEHEPTELLWNTISAEADTVILVLYDFFFPFFSHLKKNFRISYYVNSLQSLTSGYPTTLIFQIWYILELLIYCLDAGPSRKENTFQIYFFPWLQKYL